MQFNDLPNDELDAVVSWLDDKATVNLSLVSQRMFSTTQTKRCQILFPALSRRAGIDTQNIVMSLDKHPEAKPLNSAILESSMKNFGHVMVLAVYGQLQHISALPLMNSPTLIRAARELLERWHKHVFTFCGAFGYAIALPELYNQATHGGINGITYYPESALKVLRCMYALRYLLENKSEEQSALRHSVTEAENSAYKLDIITKHKGKVVIQEQKFSALETEIIDWLPLDGKLAKYQSMGQLKLNLKDEAFTELQERELVEKETPNPFKYF